MKAFFLIFLASTAVAMECPEEFSLTGKKQFVFDPKASSAKNLHEFANAYGVELDLKHPLFGVPTFKPNDPIRGWSTGRDSVTFHIRNLPNKGPVWKAAPIFSTKFPYPEFLGETWKTGTEKFHFFNSGTRLLNGGNPETLEKVLNQALKDHPGVHIEIPFDPDWARARNMLNDRQVWASNKAVYNYLKRKPYLKQEDLWLLGINDYLSKNQNDFLLLMREGRSPLELTRKEFDVNLLAMMRVARFEFAEHEYQSIVTSGQGLFQELPHHTRIPKDQKDLFDQFFRQLNKKGGLHIAELSRFNKFQEVPRPVMDAFLLKVLETAKDPNHPIDIFLLECDQFTERLFRRYGFQRLVRISSDGAKIPEYLMTLDTRSEEFKKVYDVLKESSKDVGREQNTAVPDVKNWSTDWGYPPMFQEFDPRAKKK